MKYLESVCWWRDGEFDLNYENRILNLEFDKFIECNKNGKGQLFLGAAAGFWAYMAEDKEVEAVQTECQGRGDDKCKIKAAPRSHLDNNFEVEINAGDLDISRDYKIYNEIKDTDYADNSMEDFEEVGFFEHHEGLFYHNDFRYIWTESSLIELIGSELGDEYGEELFNSAYEVGKEIAEDETDRNMEKFIVEYLSATGWGDTKIKRKENGIEVQSLMFPWTKFTPDTDFPMFRGLVSGMISAFEDREVKLKHIEKDDRGGSFSLISRE
jgi:predicted hydrocarbon binding protein